MIGRYDSRIFPPHLYTCCLGAMCIFFWATICGCSPSNNSLEQVANNQVLPGQTVDAWSQLLAKEAYPYTTPIPMAEASILDNTYEMFVAKVSPPIPCRRCPEYLAEGGIWRLRLQEGGFWILHVPTGWQGLGSFTLQDDRLYLFNDPNCPGYIGTYRWSLRDNQLELVTVEDGCAADLRGHTLEKNPWQIVSEPGLD